MSNDQFMAVRLCTISFCLGCAIVNGWAGTAINWAWDVYSQALVSLIN